MTAPRRERKVVTVVFCDLVGFTAQAESLDPEDVEALLSPYHERVRSELERHGGTVERFIGDGVMALLGAPVRLDVRPDAGEAMASGDPVNTAARSAIRAVPPYEREVELIEARLAGAQSASA